MQATLSRTGTRAEWQSCTVGGARSSHFDNPRERWPHYCNHVNAKSGIIGMVPVVKPKVHRQIGTKVPIQFQSRRPSFGDRRLG